MGSWQLEIFRMATYVSFPVAIFYIFNQPKFFQDYVLKKRAESFPPDDPIAMKFMNDLKKEVNERRDSMLAGKA